MVEMKKTGISKPEFHRPTQNVVCALCGPDVSHREKFAERLPQEEISFSCRRAPNRIHYRVVECEKCRLVFSNPIYHESQIIAGYQNAEYIQEEQTSHYLVAYREELTRVLDLAGKVGSLLEIGCGDGYFLRVAKDMGIPRVCGVEPMKSAIEKADDDLRPLIHYGAFHEGLYEENSFDIVCMFQVVDHVVDPVDILNNVARVLKPGGHILIITHDVKSWQPRLLGERSPIFDVHHIFLWDLDTIRGLIEKVGLHHVFCRRIRVQYGLAYFVRMLPLPMRLRLSLIGVLERIGMANIAFRLGGCNMVAVGRKAAE
ncbi:MAG: class I SAM-dependent methyltransferase [Pseudomonadota bacterium]|nr:class I SAM-dependent methyltransferase [Pseudomonadota bacterium]